MSQIKVDTITDELGTGTPSFPHGIDAADLTGTLPALDGSAITGLNAAELTGALPAIDGSALTGVGGSTTYGEVGTYALLYSTAMGSRSPAYTLAGSSLYPSSAFTDSALGGYYTGAGTVSGTWRLMGSIGYYSGSTTLSRADAVISVWVRIS